MARRARLDGERRATASDVVDGELVGAAVGRVVEGDLPVVAGKRRRAAGINGSDPEIVLLDPDRVEPERLPVDAVESDARATVNDQVVEDDLVGLRDGREPTDLKRH